MDRHDFLRTQLFMVSGLLIWAAHFTFLYAFNTLACTRSLSEVVVMGFGLVPLASAIATLVALAGAGIVVVSAKSAFGGSPRAQGPERTDYFLRQTTVTIALISLIAILWNGIPAIFVPPCG